MAVPALARLAAAVLTNEDGRRTAGKVLALILSPLIILAAFLCCFGDGASQHNNDVVSAAFYGAEFSDKVPKEYRTHMPAVPVQVLPYRISLLYICMVISPSCCSSSRSCSWYSSFTSA